MENIFAVITDNGGGPTQVYHDIEGEIYTFPQRYQNILTPGTQIIYHRAKKKRDDAPIPNRLSNESHYFGTAEIGEICRTEKGNLRAAIKNYKRFEHPVMLHRHNGDYYEIRPFFQQGVRAITKTVFDDICLASTMAPAPIQHHSRKGYRTTTTLNVGIESIPFGDGKYQIVTGKDGFYLKNLADGIYYQLAKVKDFLYKEGSIKVLKSSSSKTFAIQYNNSTFGYIEPITNGLRFKREIDNQEIYLNVML